MASGFRHCDCRNYAAVDVAKGICHRTKQTVLADDVSCDAFERLPKCRHCEHFAPGADEHVGTCMAARERPMTYPDLITVTCEQFAWKTPAPVSP